MRTEPFMRSTASEGSGFASTEKPSRRRSSKVLGVVSEQSRHRPSVRRTAHSYGLIFLLGNKNDVSSRQEARLTPLTHGDIITGLLEKDFGSIENNFSNLCTPAKLCTVICYSTVEIQTCRHDMNDIIFAYIHTTSLHSTEASPELYSYRTTAM
jgi:hypothetical protein